MKVLKYSLIIIVCAMIIFFVWHKRRYFQERNPFLKTLGQQAVDCASLPRDKTLVILAFGQSNSANFGNELYAPTGNVYDFFDNRCFKAKDPLMGGDGNGGSPWTRLGNMVIQQGLYENVIISSVGVGGSNIGMWVPEGNHYYKLQNAISSLRDNNFMPTYILWHQGESDAKMNTSTEEYKGQFAKIVQSIRDENISAPVFIATATICDSPPSNEIRAAQQEIPSIIEGVFAGPDTDTIYGNKYRYDNCHFNGEGMKLHSEMWLDVLVEFTQLKSNHM